MSGIAVNEDCQVRYKALKMEKIHRYIIFGLSVDAKEIVVLKTSNSQSYMDFIEDLPKNECCWAVYDFEYKNDDGGQRNKICFFSWSPTDAKIKSKMTYASSKATLRASLDGIATEVQGTDADEVSEETVLDRVRGR